MKNNMPSKLEQLKKEIKRLRPEIMFLEFGCEYIENDIPYTYLNSVYSWCEKRPIATNGNINEDEIEILGRPITLEDILFCCVEAYSKFGIITKKSYEEMLGGVVGLWNFSKDFDNQSEKFYDEISFLLEK